MSAAQTSERERREEETRQRHEFLYRHGADLFFRVPEERSDAGICTVRACRRRHLCSGPMEPSNRQIPAIRREQERGFSGRAVAYLPLCLARGTDALYAMVHDNLVPAIAASYEDDLALAAERNIRPRHNRRYRRFDKRDAFAARYNRDRQTDP